MFVCPPDRPMRHTSPGNILWSFHSNFVKVQKTVIMWKETRFPLFGHIGKIVVLRRPKTIIWNTNHCVAYIGYVSLQKLFDLWSCSPNFCNLVAKNGPNWWFLTIIWAILITESISYMVRTLVRWVFILLVKVGQIWAEKWLQFVVSDNYLEYWPLKSLHTGKGNFVKWFDFWPKLMVYDIWTVSWHFGAMSTVDLWWLSDETAIRSLDLLVLIYMITYLYKKSRNGWWNIVIWMQRCNIWCFYGTDLS